MAARERIYLDRFWNELSADPRAIDEGTRQHYAELYALPGATHSAFNQFAARTRSTTRLSQRRAGLPCLSWRSRRPLLWHADGGDIMVLVASDVRTGVIRNSGHWVMEEQPAETTAAIVGFIDKK